MRALIALALACCIGVALAASEPPAPRRADPASQQKREAGNEQQQSEPDQRGTSALPLVTDIRQAPVIKVEATDKTERHHDYSSGEWWLVYLTGGLVAVTFGLALYTALLYRQTKRLASDAETATARQAVETQASLAISKQAADAVMLAERAYLKLSFGDDGLQWETPTGRQTPLGFGLTLLVKNFGRTPASVTDIRIGVSRRQHDDVLPENFSTLTQELETRPNGFLVPGDHTDAYRFFGIKPDAYASVKESQERLWIFAYADYIDTFGQRHRTGIARNYEPIMEGGKESPVRRSGLRRYDWDRPRVPGEGNDWPADG